MEGVRGELRRGARRGDAERRTSPWEKEWLYHSTVARVQVKRGGVRRREVGRGRR